MTLKDFLAALGDQPSVVAASFAARIGVSRQAVERYRDGRVPRPEHIRKIFEATGGAVRPDDFYLPQRKRRRKAS